MKPIDISHLIGVISLFGNDYHVSMFVHKGNTFIRAWRGEENFEPARKMMRYDRNAHFIIMHWLSQSQKKEVYEVA